MKSKFLASLVALLLLAGCVSAPTLAEWSVADAGAAPTDTEVTALINAHIASNFKDPYSVREIRPGEVQPVVARMSMRRGTFIGYKVSYSCNAKNSFGAYVGSKTYHFYVRNGVDAGDVL